MKKLSRFTFCFICIPLFFVSCASKPENSQDTKAELEAPLLDTESDAEAGDKAEGEYEGDEADLGDTIDGDTSEEDSEQEADEDTELEAGEKDGGSALEDETEGELTGEDLSGKEDTEDALENSQASENELEDLEEPEVITIEYQEPEKIEEEAEEIKTEELDLDYIDVIDDDEDDEIRTSSQDIEIEAEVTPSEENENQDQAEIQSESEEVQNTIEVSRKVSMKIQEYVDITYPGNGWVYMGLTDGSKDMSYFGRKLGTKDTKFTLQAKAAGTKYVHFYRIDPLTNEYIDDYIEIEVSDEKGSNKTHIQAPEYKTPLPKKAKELYKSEKTAEEIKAPSPEAASNASPAPVSTPAPASSESEKSEIQNTSNAPSPSAAPEDSKTSEESAIESPEKSETTEKSEKDIKSLLKEAEVLYNNKEYSSADKKIKLFLEYAVTDRDAGLFLQGQILEAKSEIQDIKSAIEAYKTLTKNYPASPYWEKASKQIIYLNRFYLEIR
ncbi:MAG: hypothetical protein J6J00_07650 [Treponema sp.]|nr:hypothetical protein [Treponema sp.]